MEAQDLKSAAREWGADVVGVADLERLRGIETDPPDLLAGYARAVSVAVRLADGVMDAIADRPTPLYEIHYKMVNARLDDIAIRIAGLVMDHGGRALPLPASLTLDRTRLTSFLSHKAVAVAAGVGWQGKSLLTVNPKYGPRIRLVTILTDLPLAPDAPLKNRCGKCDKCSKACPAGAIKNVNTESHYESRDQALFFSRCADKVQNEFARLPNVGSPICGVCVAVCPWGRS